MRGTASITGGSARLPERGATPCLLLPLVAVTTFLQVFRVLPGCHASGCAAASSTEQHGCWRGAAGHGRDVVPGLAGAGAASHSF